MLLVALLPAPCRGQNAPDEPLPKVLMLEFHGLTPYDTGLFKAIRAQLSAAPLVLDRVGLATEQAIAADPLGSASKLARENDASMVFWIEDEEPCRMFFYIPGPEGGRINNRVLLLDLNSRSSRFEVIAIAVASMVEGLLVSHQLKAASSATEDKGQVKDSSDVSPPPKKRRSWVEIFAAYDGSWFAPDMVTHGAWLGLGLLPIERMVISASFTQNLPMTLEDDEFRLTLISRDVELGLAGRVLMSPVDLRLGVSWSMDLRSFSTTARSERITPEPDGFKGVNVLMPYLSAAWLYKERIGIFGRLGASIAINETAYKILRDDRADTVLEPFRVKLSYELGVIVQI